MGFDDENNHVGAKEIGIHTIIPTRYADVLIWRTSGKYRKEIKEKLPSTTIPSTKQIRDNIFCNKTADVRGHYIKK